MAPPEMLANRRNMTFAPIEAHDSATSSEELKDEPSTPASAKLIQKSLSQKLQCSTDLEDTQPSILGATSKFGTSSLSTLPSTSELVEVEGPRDATVTFQPHRNWGSSRRPLQITMSEEKLCPGREGFSKSPSSPLSRWYHEESAPRHPSIPKLSLPGAIDDSLQISMENIRLVEELAVRDAQIAKLRTQLASKGAEIEEPIANSSEFVTSTDEDTEVPEGGCLTSTSTCHDRVSREATSTHATLASDSGPRSLSPLSRFVSGQLQSDKTAVECDLGMTRPVVAKVDTARPSVGISGSATPGSVPVPKGLVTPPSVGVPRRLASYGVAPSSEGVRLVAEVRPTTPRRQVSVPVEVVSTMSSVGQAKASKGTVQPQVSPVSPIPWTTMQHATAPYTPRLLSGGVPSQNFANRVSLDVPELSYQWQRSHTVGPQPKAYMPSGPSTSRWPMQFLPTVGMSSIISKTPMQPQATPRAASCQVTPGRPVSFCEPIVSARSRPVGNMQVSYTHRAAVTPRRIQ